ncbi:hypothetical protein OROGR_011873 [Orobanche gracilis]
MPLPVQDRNPFLRRLFPLLLKRDKECGSVSRVGWRYDCGSPTKRNERCRKLAPVFSIIKSCV